MSSKKENDFKDNLRHTLGDIHVHHKDVYIHTLKQIRHNHKPYEQVFNTEKILLLLIIILKMIMPSFWVRHFSEQNKKHHRYGEFYNFAKILLFCCILLYHLDQFTIVMIIVTYLLIDLFVSIISTLLLSDIFVKPISIRKQFLSLSTSLCEIIFGFAILYLHYDALGYITESKPIGPIGAIYYSMCTLSTVGYGDIAQINDIGSILSVLQMIYGLVFVGIILSAFVGKVHIKSD